MKIHTPNDYKFSSLHLFSTHKFDRDTFLQCYHGDKHTTFHNVFVFIGINVMFHIFMSKHMIFHHLRLHFNFHYDALTSYYSHMKLLL